MDRKSVRKIMNAKPKGPAKLNPERVSKRDRQGLSGRQWRKLRKARRRPAA